MILLINRVTSIGEFLQDTKENLIGPSRTHNLWRVFIYRKIHNRYGTICLRGVVQPDLLSNYAMPLYSSTVPSQARSPVPLIKPSYLNGPQC